MAKSKRDGTKVEMRVVSFKVSIDLFERLEKLAKQEIDEAGALLTASTVARRLMLQALPSAEKKHSK